MYTIMRFTAEPSIIDEIVNIGLSMNSLQPGIFSGLRKRGDGFSCEVCNDPKWEVHVTEILQFVSRFDGVMQQMLRIGATVTVDIAIEPEDMETGGPIFVLDYSPSFLVAVASAGLRMEVSIY